MAVRQALKTASFVAIAAVIVASTAAAASAPTLTTAKITGVGSIIVSGDGLTVYSYAAETAGKIACTGACAKAWPPVLIKTGTAPVAGAGIKAAKLGTIKRADGGLQVTYGGHALYRYKGDTTGGDINGQGASGTWYAVSPAGGVVKTMPAKAAAGSGSTSSSGSSSSSSSGGSLEGY